MHKIIACVLLVLVGLTSCLPAVPVQPIISFTPANTTVPAPVITPSDNPITIIPANATVNPTPPWSNVNVHTDNNSVIKTGVNQEFAIGLNFRPPLPYLWLPSHGEDIVSVDKFFPPNPFPSPPINATQWFLFKALHQGKTTISFSYLDGASAKYPTPVLNQRVFNVEIK